MGNVQGVNELSVFAVPLTALLYISLTKDPVIPFPPRRETHNLHPQNQRPLPDIPGAVKSEQELEYEREVRRERRRLRKEQQQQQQLQQQSASPSPRRVNTGNPYVSPHNARLLSGKDNAPSPLASINRASSQQQQQCVPPLKSSELRGEAARPWSEYLLGDEMLLAEGGGDGSLNATAASLNNTIHRESSLRNFAAQMKLTSGDDNDENNCQQNNNRVSTSPSPARPPGYHQQQQQQYPEFGQQHDDDDDNDDGEDDDDGVEKFSATLRDADIVDENEKTAVALDEIEREVKLRGATDLLSEQFEAGIRLFAVEFASSLEALRKKHEQGKTAAMKASRDRLTALLNALQLEQTKTRNAIENDQLGAIGRLRREFERK